MAKWERDQYEKDCSEATSPEAARADARDAETVVKVQAILANASQVIQDFRTAPEANMNPEKAFLRLVVNSGILKCTSGEAGCSDGFYFNTVSDFNDVKKEWDYDESQIQESHKNYENALQVCRH